MKNRFYYILLFNICFAIISFIILKIITFFNNTFLSFISGVFCFAYYSFFADKLRSDLFVVSFYDSRSDDL